MTTTRKSSETKILEAAESLFLKKGYANTRTRDIAETAGINLALLNYYFRSKEQLFHKVMESKIRTFFLQMSHLLDKEKSTPEKIRMFVSGYIDLLSREPELPLFILGELRAHPETFLKKHGAKGIWKKLGFLPANTSRISAKEKQAALQFFISLFGMTVFPFIARPVLMEIGELNDKEFLDMMNQRKTLIPQWAALIRKNMESTAKKSK